MIRRALLPVLAGLGLATAGCVFGLLGGAEPGLDRELQNEREVTSDVARQIRDGAPLVRDPILLAYLNELGQEIVRTTEPQPFIYRFALIEDDSLNAFTIGGGYVYMNTGVFAQSGDVSELAGVLAHEIGHVRNRHVAKRGEGQELATLATLAAMAAVALAGADPAVMMMGQSLNVALQLRNSRRAESEADRDGIGYMVKAGYQPRGMVRFFERIQLQRPRGAETVPAYLFTHPAVDERISAAKLQISQLQLPSSLRTREDRLDAMQARLAELRFTAAGGSSLQARAQFDRARSDPLLETARAAEQAGNLDEADRILEQAGQQEPNDPRIPLARANLAESRRDLAAATAQLERAFEIDPYAPLVQYRLGHLHGLLGNRSQAVFYLEQAATTYRGGTPGRARAEAEIDLVTFPVFETSGVGLEEGTRLERFEPGSTARWWGKLEGRFGRYAEKVVVRWIAPDGSVASETTAQPGSSSGVLTAELALREQAPGAWQVEVLVADTRAALQRFELVAPAVR